MSDFQDLYDEIRRLAREAVHEAADKIADEINSNLDVQNLLELDELVEQEIENASVSVTCARCMDSPDVDGVCFSGGDLEVTIDECANCMRDEIASKIQDDYGIYIHSNSDIEYDIERVEVSGEEIHIYVNDQELGELPEEIWVVKFGEFIVHRYFTDRIGVDAWCDTEPAKRLLESIRMASGSPDLQPQAVIFKREL